MMARVMAVGIQIGASTHSQLRIIFGRSTAEAEEYKLERLKKRLDTATAAEASHRG